MLESLHKVGKNAAHPLAVMPELKFILLSTSRRSSFKRELSAIEVAKECTASSLIPSFKHRSSFSSAELGFCKTDENATHHL